MTFRVLNSSRDSRYCRLPRNSQHHPLEVIGGSGGFLVRESSQGCCGRSITKRLCNVDEGTKDVSVFLFRNSTETLCDVLLVRCNHIMLKGFVMEICEIKFVHLF